MPFSAILGLAGSAIGAASASRDAAAARAQQDYQFGKQMDLQNANLGMMRDAQRDQRAENEYQREMERFNRRLRSQEREFELGQLRQNQEYLMEDRRMDIERQVKEDKEAAKIQQFNLEQLLRRQDIAEDERQFAIQQLEQVKAIASGERDEDKRRFLEEREMARIEREFLTDQFNEAKGQAQIERNEQLQDRNAIMQSISGMQNAVQNTAAGLGYIPEIKQLTSADISSEIDRRTNQYQGDVDRAADRVASVGEAGLIRGGMDRSTQGTARRGDIAERIANEYQDARSRAYDDALRYITGEQSALTSNVDSIMKRRSGILGETANVAGAGIDQMMKVPQAASAVDAYRLAQMVPSAIYNRNLESANDFRAPVGISSAAIGGTMTPGIADYTRPTSRVSNAGFNIDSAIFNPYGVTTNDPNTYMSNAMNIGNNLYNAAATSASNAADRSYQASSGFGQSFNKFLNNQSQGAQFGITGVGADGTPSYGQTSGPGMFNGINQRTNDFFGNLFGG